MYKLFFLHHSLSKNRHFWPKSRFTSLLWDSFQTVVFQFSLECISSLSALVPQTRARFAIPQISSHPYRRSRNFTFGLWTCSTFGVAAQQELANRDSIERFSERQVTSIRPVKRHHFGSGERLLKQLYLNGIKSN